PDIADWWTTSSSCLILHLRQAWSHAHGQRLLSRRTQYLLCPTAELAVHVEDEKLTCDTRQLELI
uniref:IPIL1 protein n=1 Tax=Macrostomum lignano TaxID=282301 RepID=A0A1I8F888_9PLAT